MIRLFNIKKYAIDLLPIEFVLNPSLPLSDLNCKVYPINFKNILNEPPEMLAKNLISFPSCS